MTTATKIRLYITQPNFPVKIYGCYANADLTAFSDKRTSEFNTLCTLPREEKEKLLSQANEEIEGREINCTLVKKEGGKGRNNNVFYYIKDAEFNVTSTEIDLPTVYNVTTSYELRKVEVYELTVTARSPKHVYECVTTYLDPCSGTAVRNALDEIRNMDAYKQASVPSLLNRDNTLDAIEEYVKTQPASVTRRS